MTNTIMNQSIDIAANHMASGGTFKQAYNLVTGLFPEIREHREVIMERAVQLYRRGKAS